MYKRIFIINCLVSLLILLSACSEPSPTATVVAAASHTPTQRPTATATATLSPTATNTLPPIPTATDTPTLPPTHTLTPPPTPTPTPNVTPLPAYPTLPIPIATLVPFATVTPNYANTEPKQVFLSVWSTSGDGATMPNVIRESNGRRFAIYTDGQIVVNGRQEGQLSAQQMCSLKHKIDSFEGMFDERESISKTGGIDYMGGGARIIQFEDKYLQVYGLEPESIIDEVAAGLDYIMTYSPPVNLRPYRFTTILPFVATAEEGSWYSRYYPEGGLTDDVLHDWPETVLPLAELISPDRGSSYHSEFVSMAAYLPQFMEHFKENLGDIRWYKEDGQIYIVIAFPLWPDHTPRNPGRYSQRSLEPYVPHFNCDSSPQFIDSALPTVTPTLVPAARSFSGYGKILFTAEIDDDVEIFVINADGTGRQQLTNNLVDDQDPSWSPDGQQIVFTSGYPHTNQIYLMESDGSNVKQLTAEGENYNPTWSPDGKRILFSSSRNGSWDSADLFTMNVDGSNQMVLNNTDFADVQAKWSPDGTMIAYAQSYESKKYELVIMRVDGTELARFEGGLALHQIKRHAWSPDSKQLAVVKQSEAGEGGSTIQLIDFENDFARRDVVTVGFVSSLDWLTRTDRDVLLFSAEEPNSDVLNLPGSESPFSLYDTELYAFNLSTNVLTQLTYTRNPETTVDWWP